MGSIWEKWKSFTETVDSTTSSIRGVLWVVLVIGVIVTAVGKWLATLNSLQIGGFIVVLTCFAFIGLTYLLDWRRKRSIDSIPELLSRIDQLTLDYIDNFTPNLNTPEALIDDLANLLKWDIRPLKSAAKSQNMKQVEQEFARFADRYDKLANPKKLQDNLFTLRLMGGLMNDRNAGLASITTTEEYQKLYMRIKTLQKRLPAADITAKVNEYFNSSEGLYSLLLSTKPFMYLGAFKELIPARARAHSRIMRPIIEGYTATLISAVTESIENYKNRGKGREEDKGKKK